MKTTITMTVEELKERMQAYYETYLLRGKVEILIANPPDKNHSIDANKMVDVGEGYVRIPKPEFETDEAQYDGTTTNRWVKVTEYEGWKCRAWDSRTIFRRKLPAITLAKLCETVTGRDEVVAMLRESAGSATSEAYDFLIEYLRGATK